MAGFKVWVPGERVGSADLNDYIQEQVIPQFASTSARDAAILTPVEGMHCITTDTDTMWAYTSAAWVGCGGYGNGISFTPTITQSGSVAFTNTASFYSYLGNKIIRVEHSMSVTGSGTTNNNITISTPLTLASASFLLPLGYGRLTDNGTATYPFFFVLNTAGSVAMARVDATTNGALGTDPNFALASGDTIYGSYLARIA